MTKSPGASHEGAGASSLATAQTAYVIDTSVAIKWYIPEAHSLEAKAYIGKGVDRHAPDYLLAEAASVVLKRLRSRDDKLRLSVDEGRIVLAAMKVSPIQFHESRPLIDQAFALAHEIGASLYDGLFLALALRIGGQLVTADKKLFTKIQGSRHVDRARWVEDAPVTAA
jgi:predicted nucleic acid-binding protein